MNRLIFISIVILAIGNHSVSAGTLYDVVLGNAAQFSMVLQAMKDAGFAELVQQKDLGEFTIFAPTDAAFKAVTDDALKKRLKDEIKMILLGHVIQGKFPSTALTDGLELPALDGENNKIAITPAGKTINGANILNEYPAENGVVYAIDKIIFH